jgi:hypothetical protein
MADIENEAGSAAELPRGIDSPQDKAALLADFIRENTKKERLTPRFDLTKDPLSMPAEELDALFAELAEKEDGKTITELRGKKERYYYCAAHMADNYAKMLLLAEEKDIYQTIAEIVRFNGKTYPRATSLASLALAPISLDIEKAKIAITLLEKRSEYSDIKTLTVSNGEIYLYSTMFMDAVYAQSLAQFEAVDWKNYQ